MSDWKPTTIDMQLESVSFKNGEFVCMSCATPVSGFDKMKAPEYAEIHECDCRNNGIFSLASGSACLRFYRGSATQIAIFQSGPNYFDITIPL